MMKKLALIPAFILLCMLAAAQTLMTDSERMAKKDSTLRATMHADSVKIENQFAMQEKWDKLFALAQYPLIKEAKMAGVIPVVEPTEIPDPNMEYKLLFEVVEGNPDSLNNEVDASLAEVARIINLHIASGIPLKKIVPVIVVHGSALNAISNNDAYQTKFKIDNPNLKLLDELKKLNTKLIACGQAMAYFDVKKEELLPDVKISLTAQTVLTGYQLKGYVLKRIVLN